MEWYFRIYGRVQGVGYRKNVCRFVEEQGLPLRGFVRNVEDGSVEIVARGEEKDLNALLAYCQKGPRLSQVTEVKVEKRSQDGDGPDDAENFSDFSVRF